MSQKWFRNQLRVAFVSVVFSVVFSSSSSPAPCCLRLMSCVFSIFKTSKLKENYTDSVVCVLFLSYKGTWALLRNCAYNKTCRRLRSRVYDCLGFQSQKSSINDVLFWTLMADKGKKDSTPPPLLLMPAGGGLTLNPPDQPNVLMPVIQSEPSLFGSGNISNINLICQQYAGCRMTF